MGRARTGTTVSGNLNTLVAGTKTYGEVLELGPNVWVGTVSCHYLVDVETNTIVVASGWEVSNVSDFATKFELADQNNAAIVALGTAGADASIEKVIPLPLCAHGWLFARPFVRNTVVTGAAADTYAMTNHWRKVG